MLREVFSVDHNVDDTGHADGGSQTIAWPFRSWLGLLVASKKDPLHLNV